MFDVVETIYYITSDGEKFILHNPPKSVVMEITGLGISPFSINTTKGPFQQGSTPINIQLEERKISFRIRHNAKNRQEFWKMRNTFIGMVRENKTGLQNPKPGILQWVRYENGKKITRCLDVIFTEGFVFRPDPTDTYDLFAIDETLTFVAYNPIWYDPNKQTYTLNFQAEQLVFPVIFPFVLDAKILTGNITYVGDWEEYPTIIIQGPISNFSIINTSLQKRINIYYDVRFDETVTINLTYGYKTIESNLFGNILYAMRNSDIGDFLLAPNSQVTGGINNIQVIATDFDPNKTKIIFNYYNRYRGI